ncbi:hypothetical protein [Gilvibacter sediminis]|uniref:hypothetical protein n=1 Tax=Gilvibacter sediminis TaxID=379071 RepID=UPI00234FD64F|nr:hypothetical protein [Gilvibacter sediminis]MDC7998987.1 hypothetical protein [Gilvibacter sediminis]
MDQLELLKKQWQAREQELPKLSFDDIYPMILKKSSSVVKWILIASVIEIAIWIGLNFLIPESSKTINQGMGLSRAFTLVNVIHYTIFAGFIYLFYRNYQAINSTDTLKELMRKILKTRRTVRYFVYYNIGTSVLTLFAVNIYYYFNKEQLYGLLKATFPEGYAEVDLASFTSVFFISQIIVGILFIGFIALIYYLVYGLMLRRLKRNYVELKKMEV